MSTVGTINPHTAPRSADSTPAKLRRMTDQIVGSVFYGTLLRTMRASTFRGKHGHGGRGEEVFAAQLDQVLAERAGAARSYNLSETIADRLADHARSLDRWHDGGGGAR